MRWGCLSLIAFLLLSLPVGCGGAEDSQLRVRLVTTTSTRDSGLAAKILPAFQAASGIDVQVLGVGTGQALALGRRGEADLLLVHAREREDAFVAEGHAVLRRDVMWNDFVILGPAHDPAKIRSAKGAHDALRKIGATDARFVSRGDDSGTHIRELALWQAAGGRPEFEGYFSTGLGMGASLTHADEKQAYILVDRGTYLSRKARLELVVLLEGDPALRNPYGALLINAARHPHVNAKGAQLLLDFLTSPEGQAAIAGFRVGGEPLFHPTKAN